MVELPGRGETFVTDTPGPTPDSPAILLLHAVGTTGLLSWYPAIKPLSQRFRVLTMDQRWHGRGIQSPEFSLSDCADDAAALIEVLGLRDPIVGGYSMGSMIAQLVWRQHPDLVEGLVLGATTDHFRNTPWERGFHASMELAMGG
ncbi:alpha/beta fold hydrolase [Nocardioides piscis]|uniref:alpha/beta fold hydrolase n=1 Tax=Nocardioides piscis TaxID=2714938 RepID=UPI001FE6FA87|nr:alpha/beta hydrolase [Nocardioides piscis]